MKLDVAVFEVPLLRSLNDVKLPTPSKSPLFNVIVQIAVNTRKIEKDEILYFSTHFMVAGRGRTALINSKDF